MSDDQKRAAYDQYGAAGANGGFGGAGGFGGFDGAGGFGGFEDIFSSFFGGGGASRNPNAPRQGDDLQYRVNLTFEEAILELKKRLSTIVKQAVVHVMALVLSQEQVQSLVDAVMALVSLTLIHRLRLV